MDGGGLGSCGLVQATGPLGPPHTQEAFEEETTFYVPGWRRGGRGLRPVPHPGFGRAGSAPVFLGRGVPYVQVLWFRGMSIRSVTPVALSLGPGLVGSRISPVGAGSAVKVPWALWQASLPRAGCGGHQT